MFDHLRKMSRVFTVLAIIHAVFLIPVFVYMYDHQLSLDLNDHPIFTICILVLLLFHSISFTVLAVLTKGLAETFFRYDLGIDERIKDYCKKEKPNP